MAMFDHGLRQELGKVAKAYYAYFQVRIWGRKRGRYRHGDWCSGRGVREA